MPRIGAGEPGLQWVEWLSCWEEGGVARGWLGIYNLKGHSFAASFARSDLQRLLDGIEALQPPFHVEAALCQVHTCTNQSVSLFLWIFLKMFNCLSTLPSFLCSSHTHSLFSQLCFPSSAACVLFSDSATVPTDVTHSKILPTLFLSPFFWSLFIPPSGSLNLLSECDVIETNYRTFLLAEGLEQHSISWDITGSAFVMPSSSFQIHQATQLFGAPILEDSF